MGPYRTKPLDVLEQEIDQLTELYPGKFLQFTDDNLLANRNYGTELLALIRRKKKRFVTMVTVDQFCDSALIEEMASSGCLGVAVGVESMDDDNCASVSKYQNLQKPFSDAVSHANKYGIQTCTVYDIRILRIYPSTSLYTQMLSSGDVTEDWWLEKESASTCNHLLPSCLSMHFKHSSFNPMHLQHLALQLIAELNWMKHDSVSHILRVGYRGHGLKFAVMMLSVRQRFGRA